jgi:Ca2+-transporting ATPase
MAIGLSVCLSAIAVFTPFGHFVLGTESLTAYMLIGCFGIAALPTLVLSGIKEIFGWRVL